MKQSDKEKIIEFIKQYIICHIGHEIRLIEFIKSLPVDDTPTIKDVKDYCEKEKIVNLYFDFEKDLVTYELYNTDPKRMRGLLYSLPIEQITKILEG